jgi:hypothetical protein
MLPNCDFAVVSITSDALFEILSGKFRFLFTRNRMASPFFYIDWFRVEIAVVRFCTPKKPPNSPPRCFTEPTLSARAAVRF